MEEDESSSSRKGEGGEGDTFKVAMNLMTGCGRRRVGGGGVVKVCFEGRKGDKQRGEIK